MGLGGRHGVRQRGLMPAGGCSPRKHPSQSPPFLALRWACQDLPASKSGHFFAGHAGAYSPAKPASLSFIKQGALPGQPPNGAPRSDARGKPRRSVCGCAWLYVCPWRLRFRSLPPTQSGKLVLGRGGGPGAWCMSMRTSPPLVRAARGYGGGGLWQDPGAFEWRSGAGLHWIPEIGKLLANR
jgi:hypothetical protein